MLSAYVHRESKMRHIIYYDLENSITATFSRKSAIKWLLKIPPLLNHQWKWKSMNIWWRYRHEYDVLYILTHNVIFLVYLVALMHPFLSNAGLDSEQLYHRSQQTADTLAMKTTKHSSNLFFSSWIFFHFHCTSCISLTIFVFLLLTFNSPVFRRL